MQKRPLGKSGLSVSPIMFGGNVLGWTANLLSSHRLLDAFVGYGFNAIDTADVYSDWALGNEGGESEMVIGAWLAIRRKRDDVVICSKVGSWPKRPGLRKANIVKACEESLERLRTDYIDLYSAHIDDRATPLEETMEAFAALKKAGKIRAIGASNFTVDRLKAAQAAVNGVRYDAMQPHYNLMERVDFETAMKPYCVAEGIGVTPYYGLASGFLTGKYRSDADLGKSARGAAVGKYLNERGLHVLDALDEVAGRLHAKPAQVALAWLMARPSVASAIVSATSEAQLTETLGAARLVLSKDDMALLDRASS